MALAYLSNQGIDANEWVFNADIGSNIYYRFSIGAARGSRDGVDQLRDITYQSELRHLAKQNLWRSDFQIRIPVTRFDNQFRYLQLESFRNTDGKSPTWSRVVEVRPALYSSHQSIQQGDITMNSTPISPFPCRSQSQMLTFESCRSVSNTFSESQLSSAMFWEQLLNVARVLLPTSSRLASQAVNQYTGAQVSPNTVQQIIEALLQAAGQVGTNNMQNTPLVANASYSNSRTGFYHSLNRSTHLGKAVSRAQDGGLISGPLLAGLISTLGPSVLSALGPVLESAPQLLSTLVDSPLRLLNAINEAKLEEKRITNARIQDMLTQGNQALLLTLLNNTPRNNNNGVAPLLSAANSQLSLAAQQSIPKRRGYSVRYGKMSRHLSLASDSKSHSNLSVRFQWPELIHVDNKPKAVFSAHSAINLLLALDLHNSQQTVLPKAIVTLRIINSLDSTVLHEQELRIKTVEINKKLPIVLNKQTVEKLPRYTDLVASVLIKWMDTQNNVHTASNRAAQTLYLAGEYLLGAIGERRQQEFDLSDPNRFRSFWHRVWEGGSSQHKRWYFEMIIRYYYTLAQGERSNARSETKIRLNESDSKDTSTRVTWKGMLKSGMELSVSELNKLLALTADQETWTAPELAALNSFEFEQHLNQQATANIELRGRTEERGSLWVFPIIDITTIELKRISEISANGAVLATESLSKGFPLPVSAIFVGAELEG